MRAGIEAFVRELVKTDCDSIYDAIEQCKFQRHSLIMCVIEDVQSFEHLWQSSYFNIDVNTDINCVMEYVLRDVFIKFINILSQIKQGFYPDLDLAYKTASKHNLPTILLFEIDIRTRSKEYWECIKQKVAIENLQQDEV